MPDEPIPFTTGPLTGWPLFEEAIEHQLAENEEQIASRLSLGKDFLEWARPRVLEGTKRAFGVIQQELQKQSAIPATFTSSKDAATAQELVDKVRRLYEHTLFAALAQIIAREFVIADLKWRHERDGSDQEA